MNAVEPDHQDYVGRTEYARGRVEILPLGAMAALLDCSFEKIAPDGRVPPLWHWLLLQKHVPSGQIGEDGHPRRGDFMPPIQLPRRMFAGSRSRFLRPLFVGYSQIWAKRPTDFCDCPADRARPKGTVRDRGAGHRLSGDRATRCARGIT
jgi:hydroxyacyl-ACP dehydratase HTD2-like protein with hotdog domain